MVLVDAAHISLSQGGGPLGRTVAVPDGASHPLELQNRAQAFID
jgi:hypothetical protein